MANLKTAIKSIRKTKRQTAHNRTIRVSMKSIIKEIRDLAAKGKVESAKKKLSSAYKKIDKAAKVNVIHKNTAARYKSRLTKLINKTKPAKKSKK